ncbi:MAG: Na+/H+ antiporter NhaC family protein [Lachnospiraceae bacterium]|nr:Na+/H+ antiporter NhaC family protein [Lachnospiraceae bacterium]
MAGTFWAVLPPIIAIVLALLTKEVYSSLFIGILVGALLYTGFHPLTAAETLFDVMGEKVSGNMEILIFLVMLGILVSLVTKSGASSAYGKWATNRIKTRRGAALATSALGALIFVDDYFNCLTVGTVMRPVTDHYKISRAKLAYLIDATAAPICIIAPISSWAAAVGSSLPEDANIDGFSLFLQTIPFNLYALLTLVFMIWLTAADIDFLAMENYNRKAIEEQKESLREKEEAGIRGNGKVKDLVLPILVLIVCCVLAMIYTGGFFEGGVSIVDAFANCSSAASLVLGSFAAVVFTFLLYIPRKILNFSQFCESFTEGFKAMVPAILILTFAWTLSGICSSDYLDLRGFVAGLIQSGGAGMLLGLVPAVFFAVSLGIAFATGTSWGTFGILIPVAFSIFPDAHNMLVITVAACLAGAVCGDHVSPISDTTILASAGAQCSHIDHVSTQMPYALLVAAMSLIGYLAAGFTGSGWIGLVVGAVLLTGFAIVMTGKCKKERMSKETNA